MCKLEDYGSHNMAYVWGLEMSVSWTAWLTRSQRTTQTRVYNLQPVAHYGVIFLHQWAVLPPVFACHMADLSFTWKLCDNNSVYKYMYIFFFFRNCPTSIVFHWSLWSLLPALPLLCCQPGPSSPYCCVYYVIVELGLFGISQELGCFLILAEASLCMHQD